MPICYSLGAGVDFDIIFEYYMLKNNVKVMWTHFASIICEHHKLITVKM